MIHVAVSSRLGGPLLACLMILAGCKGAGAPLGEADEMFVDAALIGTWMGIAEADDADDDPATLRVWAFNEHEYYVEWETEDDDQIARLRAFSSDLGDYMFSNIQCINCGEDDRSEWFFFQFELESPDVLILQSIGDRHYSDALSSMTRSRDVRRYVEQHMNDTGFFEDSVARFQRVHSGEESN